MKLSKIATILEENIDTLLVSVTSAKPTDATSSKYSISHLDEFRAATENIAKTGLFAPIIEDLHKVPIYGHAFESFIVSSQHFKQFSEAALSIYNTAALLIDAIHNALPEQSETTIAVKLPEVYEFDELIEILRKLEKAFSLAVINPTVNGAVLVESLEPGSKWININVASTAAATLIGALVYAGCTISNQMDTHALQVEQLRTISLKNDALETVVKAQDDYIDMLVHTEAQRVYSEQFPKDPEQENRLRNSIKLFAEIIHMGGEVHPALNAPAEVKATFPDKPPHLLEPRTKSLEQSSRPNGAPASDAASM
jgi:hypothetical protein